MVLYMYGIVIRVDRVMRGLLAREGDIHKGNNGLSGSASPVLSFRLPILEGLSFPGSQKK
jgi:hypothetical protein